MVIVREPYTIPALSTTLLHLSQAQGKKSILTEGMRAVFQEAEGEELAKRLSEKMMHPASQLGSSLTEVRALVEEVQQAVKELREERAKTLEGMAAALTSLGKTVTYVSVTTVQAPPLQARHQGHHTQSNIAKLAMLAKGNAKAWQVLIDKVPGTGLEWIASLAGLKPAELVAKANIALEVVQGEQGLSAKVVAATKLRNGGILYELDNAAVTQLIWDKDEFRAAFLRGFSSHAMVKPRLYPIIAEHVPLSFRPDSEAELCNLEDANSLRDNVIARARCIKLPSHCEPNQRAAHLILLTSDSKTANHLIKDGVRIEQMVIWCRKLLKEPTWCLKCHKIGTGHFPSSCTAKEETCSTCGGVHLTRDCPMSAKDERYCINCKQKGHAAWDRGVPSLCRTIP